MKVYVCSLSVESELRNVGEVLGALYESRHLADCDGLSFISESEPTKLRVVGETFYTNSCGGLEESDDLLACGQETKEVSHCCHLT